MISATSDFAMAIESTSRRFKARLIVDGLELDCAIKSIKCYKGSCGDELSIGCVYAPYIEAELMQCNTNLDNKVITYQIGVLVESAYEYITVGKFTALDPETANGSTSVTAVGTLSMIGSNTYESALTYPTTINAVINEISTALGVSITLKGLAGTGEIESKIDGLYRDALGTIAGLLGGFVTEDNQGNIVIAKYGSGEMVSIMPYRSLSLPVFRETAYTVSGIHVTVSESYENEEGSVVPEIYYESGLPVIFQANKWMTQALFDAMTPNFVGLSFDLATIDISLGDPRIEPWDTLSVTDLNSNVYSVPCFEIIHTFDGGFSSEVIAEIAGISASSNRVKGAITQEVRRINDRLLSTQATANAALSTADTAIAETENLKNAVIIDETIPSVKVQAGTGAVEVKSDTVEIKKDEEVLTSIKKDEISLGKNATASKIKMCGENYQIIAEDLLDLYDTEYYAYNFLGDGNYYPVTDNNWATQWAVGTTHTCQSTTWFGFELEDLELGDKFFIGLQNTLTFEIKYVLLQTTQAPILSGDTLIITGNITNEVAPNVLRVTNKIDKHNEEQYKTFYSQLQTRRTSVEERSGIYVDYDSSSHHYTQTKNKISNSGVASIGSFHSENGDHQVESRINLQTDITDYSKAQIFLSVDNHPKYANIEITSDGNESFVYSYADKIYFDANQILVNPLSPENRTTTRLYVLLDGNTSISANSYTTGTYNISLAGYYPITVEVRSNTTAAILYRCTIENKTVEIQPNGDKVGKGKINWAVRNVSSSSIKPTVRVRVLWEKITSY